MGAAAAATSFALPGCTSAARAVELSDDDLAITNTVFFDVGLCSTATKQDRTLGAKNIFCTRDEAAYLGRVEIGLYGNLVPNSTQSFVEAVFHLS